MEFDTESTTQNGINTNKIPDNDEKFIVKYRQNFYDISKFMKKHPGGINTLKGLNNGDMTARFMHAPPHSDAAMYLMKEYEIKGMGKKNSIKNGTKPLENGIELLTEEDSNNNQLDDSMEHLVDWSKAMVPQIQHIGKHYDEWVHKPVDRPLRLFGPSYLEICTKTPWYVIPLFWIPVILKCVYSEFASSLIEFNISKLLTLSTFFIFGIFFWTLLEYSLHRWLFHMKINENTHPWLCTLHFMIHGLHHKVPFDPLRLVFPPLPGALLASSIYAPLSFILPYPRIVMGGACLGYLGYDLMHYYLHYGNPVSNHMYHMKRYHYQHHFAHQEMGFGITSTFWDLIFDTAIQLRKLRFHLRWK